MRLHLLTPALALWAIFFIFIAAPGCSGDTPPGGGDGGGAGDGGGGTIDCSTDDDCGDQTARRACRDNQCVDPGCPSGMTYVSAGTFTQGCDKSDKDCGADAQPSHDVTLSRAFCISRTELTVAQFRACVAAGRCQAPQDLACTPAATWTATAGQNEQLPVNCMLWTDAQAACQFLGGRLPSEAEWEKAARGSDKRKYPWGNQTISACTTGVNWGGGSNCSGSTWPVGSGKGSAALSASAAYDMAGNVWEWTSDWYDQMAYQSCTAGCTDPTGPTTGVVRVRRGGSYQSPVIQELRGSYREFHLPTIERSDMNGVRCAAVAP